MIAKAASDSAIAAGETVSLLGPNGAGKSNDRHAARPRQA